MTKLAPIHPGEILREEYLGPLGLSATKFAQAINVPPNRITRLLNETSNITADTAMRLARAFRTTPAYWMNLQTRYELLVAEDTSPAIHDIKPVIAA